MTQDAPVYVCVVLGTAEDILHVAIYRSLTPENAEAHAHKLLKSIAGGVRLEVWRDGDFISAYPPRSS